MLVITTLLLWVVSFFVFALLLIPRVDILVIVPYPTQVRMIAAFMSFGLLSLASATLLLAHTLLREQERASTLEHQLREGAVALEKSRRTLDTLLGHADSTILIFDRFGSVAYVNPAHERILGYSPEEYREDQALGDRIVLSQDREKRADYFTRLSQLDVPLEPVVIHYHSRAGGIVHLEYTASPILGGVEEVIGALLMGRDITRQRLAEEALRESEEKYRNLFEHSSLAMAKAGEDGTILLANRKFEELTGYSREELVGSMKVLHVMAPDVAEEVSRYHTGRRKGESVPARYESVLLTKDGRRRDVVITAGLIPGSDEDVTFIEDVTERKRLERQLQESSKMEALGRLAGGIAHDFNNLMTAITGYSDLLLREMDRQDPMRKDIEVIKSAGDRATLLTGHLLAFSSKQPVQPVVLELSDVVADMREMLQRVIGEDIQLVASLNPAPGLVKADCAQLEQVILNLALNARDAMPEGGKLTIETRNIDLDGSCSQEHPDMGPGSCVELSVSDTGVGMDEETRSRIFEPFFTTKEKTLGLGLSTVFGFVRQSGGSINVHSRQGEGTVVRIRLPRVTEPSEPTADRKEKVESAYGSETILVVEDDRVVRDIVLRVLRRNGYSVLEAGTSQEALQVGKRHRGTIHLLLTDVVLPDEGGRALSERLAPSCPDMRVLYMSGYTDETIVRHGVLEPGLAFLQKPFTPSSLIRKVREVLEG